MTNHESSATDTDRGTAVLLEQVRSARTIELPARFDVHSDLELSTLTGEPGTVLMLSGSRVEFADMSSLQSIVDARLAALDRDSDLVVVSPSDELRATLELTGFDALLPVDGGRPRSDRGIPVVTLTGRLGPDCLVAIEQELDELLCEARPRVELRLIDVDSLHLGVANVIVKARQRAQERGGDIDVIVDANSPAQHVLRSVGIVRTMRP